MAPRGRGGKFSKPTRGGKFTCPLGYLLRPLPEFCLLSASVLIFALLYTGGKKFSKDLTPLDADGNPVSIWGTRDKKDESSSEEESSEDEEEESSDSAGEGPASSKPKPEEMTREQRREAAKLKKQRAIARKNAKQAAPGDMPSSEEEESSEDGDEDMPANPNHTAKSRSQASKVPSAAAGPAPSARAGGGEDMANLSRREREALQAQQARERYQKLHAEGKTDEARADLARLKLVKERREAEAARKQAEKEEREERERNKESEREAKLRAAAMGGTGAKKVDAGKGKAKK